MQSDALMGVHYFPLLEHGLPNYPPNNFYIAGQNIANPQHMPQEYLANPQFNMVGTPRLDKQAAQRQFDLFNSLK